VTPAPEEPAAPQTPFEEAERPGPEAIAVAPEPPRGEPEELEPAEPLEVAEVGPVSEEEVAIALDYETVEDLDVIEDLDLLLRLEALDAKGRG
jgi:hypothetical protein